MPHYTPTVNYKLTRGLPWKRLILVKDRYTHRLIKPTSAVAYMKTGTVSKTPISVTITAENGIELNLTVEETQDLPLGDWAFDVMATIGGVPRPVAKGTITVSALDTVTPLEDAFAMEIRYKPHTDFRQLYAWNDSNGTLVTVQNAYMQAKNSAGNTVLDLRWFSSVPTENTIAALPASQRGYLAPATGKTLELHISNMNNVSSGEYPFDLYVQDLSGDWDVISAGTLIVEPAISSPPA